MGRPICFICGREPTDKEDAKEFIETEEGYSCPECAGEVEDDTVDIINKGQVWPLSDDSEDTDVRDI